MALGRESRSKKMSFVKSEALFLVLRFWAATLRAFSLIRYVVVGPLTCGRERMCVAKANFVVLFGGGAPRVTTGGRAKSKKTRTFDSTLGFPGEDTDQATSLANSPPPPLHFFT